MKPNKEENKISSSVKYIDSNRYSTNSARRLGVDEDENYKYKLINRARLNMENRRSYNYKSSDKLYNIW